MKLPRDIPGKIFCFLVFTYGDKVQSGIVLRKAVASVSTGLQMT